MHPFLTRQKINYGIFLVEPVGDVTFNRGIIMNIGFLEVIKHQIELGINFNCFLFHDVDMLPESHKVLYRCDRRLPKHYAVAVSKWKY